MKMVVRVFAVLLGLTVLSAQAVDQPKAGKKFGDWQGQCIKVVKDQPEVCSIVQAKLVKKGEQTAPILVTAIAKHKKETVMSMRFPHGVSLPDQFTVKVDEGKPSTGEYLYCDQKGCFGQLKLNWKWIQAMKKGSNAVVDFQGRGGNKISVKVSLTGFTAGYNSLK